MFKCLSGKHYWTASRDARRCCNGYVRAASGEPSVGPYPLQGVARSWRWVRVGSWQALYVPREVGREERAA